MQGLKHNMYKNMRERALKTAGNLDGDNDAEPIYAKHVTNIDDGLRSLRHAGRKALLCTRQT